jgi:PAS domain S-box-containing protein
VVPRQSERVTRDLHIDQRLLERVLDQLPAAVILADPSGRVIMGNRRVFEILEQSEEGPADLDGYLSEIVGYHADGQRIERADWPLRRTLATGESVPDMQAQIARADGSRAWIQLSSAPIHDDEGATVAAVVTFLDITERKRAELDASAAELRTQLTLESMADAFILLDHDWELQYVNGIAERLLGRSRSDLLGQNLWEEYPEMVGTRLFEELNRARDEQVVTVLVDHFAPLDRWLELRVHPSADGWGLAVYFQDVNERKHPAARIVEHVPQALALVDDADRVQLWNPAAARATGLAAAQAVGRSVAEVLPESVAAKRVDFEGGAVYVLGD